MPLTVCLKLLISYVCRYGRGTFAMTTHSKILTSEYGVKYIIGMRDTRFSIFSIVLSIEITIGRDKEDMHMPNGFMEVLTMS